MTGAYTIMTDRERKRKLRRPVHPFQLRYKPFVIQPFMLAPVLPGESLKNLSLLARVVSDPVRSKMVGAWLDTHVYYVKLRDLDGRDDFEEMMVNPDKSLASYYATSQDLNYYHPANAVCINWTKLCYERVVAEYFRADNEAWDDYTFANGLASAQVANVPGWLDSVIADDDSTAEDIEISTAGDNAFTINEWELAYNRWILAKNHNLTQKSFEDYLADSGVGSAAAQEPHVPELIAMDRKWTYPTNTVEPTDGTVASAYVWSCEMRRDSAKFFPEPGFLLGVQCMRPKVYFGNLDGSAAHAGLVDMRRWLPPELRNDPRATQITHTATNGPAGTGFDTEDYRWSTDDIFMHGDQFVNFDPVSDTAASKVALPIDGTDLLNTRYPTETDANALFVDQGVGDTLLLNRVDGVVNLSIDSYLEDTIRGVPISD